MNRPSVSFCRPNVCMNFLISHYLQLFSSGFENNETLFLFCETPRTDFVSEKKNLSRQFFSKKKNNLVNWSTIDKNYSSFLLLLDLKVSNWRFERILFEYLFGWCDTFESLYFTIFYLSIDPLSIWFEPYKANYK